MQQENKQVKYEHKHAEPIRPKNDAWMVMHANRVPKLAPISFEKTKQERDALNKVRNSKSRKGPNSNGSMKADHSLEHRLIVHVKNLVTINKNKFHTTYSFNCQKNDINVILNAYNIKKENIVKMYWNGKPVK